MKPLDEALAANCLAMIVPCQVMVMLRGRIAAAPHADFARVAEISLPC
jgi:hypothetical protein